MPKRFCVDRSSEHGQNLIHKNKIQERQNQTADNDHYDGISHTLSGCFRLFLPKAQTDKCAAPVSDHDRNCQCYNRQRKHDRIRRIAIGPQI